MIEEIRKAFKQNRYEYSLHAVDKSILKHIRTKEVLEAIKSGQIIEDYPKDKYCPSCLIFGMTELGRPLHIQCSYPSRSKIKIVTVYEADPEEWRNYTKRRWRRK
ncbi:MAG: DUF4258 domain-containing protein [Candidatus Omnitrophica bacterium]|nr:DUF4258 domain-containing protein [Candidatus Omnitrophota bacterium]MBU1785194.1 DUF4258 domain-containing protein [Candidatus Omnitrophota bacterium]